MASTSSGNRPRNHIASRTPNLYPRLRKKRQQLAEAQASRTVQDTLDEWVDKIEQRTYLTFLSRARASSRLEMRGILWMISLSTASATALCASVFSLATAHHPVSRIDLSAVIFSLATLVLSLIVSALNYQRRSRDMFHSFREIQRISSRLESLRQFQSDPQRLALEVAALETEYQKALDKSENHTTQDYYRARPERDGDNKKRQNRHKTLAAVQQSALTGLPVAVIAASLSWLVTLFATYGG